MNKRTKTKILIISQKDLYIIFNLFSREVVEEKALYKFEDLEEYSNNQNQNSKDNNNRIRLNRSNNNSIKKIIIYKNLNVKNQIEKIKDLKVRIEEQVYFLEHRKVNVIVQLKNNHKI